MSNPSMMYIAPAAVTEVHRHDSKNQNYYQHFLKCESILQKKIEEKYNLRTSMTEILRILRLLLPFDLFETSKIKKVLINIYSVNCIF